MKPIPGKTARKRISKELLELPHGGIELIATERARQISVEGFSHENDLTRYGDGRLSVAAACYAVNCLPEVRVIQGNCKLNMDAWPMDYLFDKRTKHDRLRSLVIAGALIAAEIDRLQSSQKK